MAMYGSNSIGFFLASGYNLLASKLQGIAEKVAAAQTRTDGLGDAWAEHTPTGMKESTLSQDGAFYDAGTNLAHEAHRTPPTTASRVVCLAFEGNTMGKRFIGWSGAMTTAYEVLANLGNLTKANATYTISGNRDEGIILQPLETKTGDWNTESSDVDYTADPGQRVVPITSNSIANPSVVTTPIPHGLTTGDIILISGVASSSPTINGERTVTVTSTTTFTVPVNVTVGGTGGSFVKANSTGGGMAYQQVTAFSGFTGFVGKIRDSADGVTYADLATFANVTSAPSAEAVTVAGTVDRYLAYDGNVTGSGSITVFGGFARR